MVTNLDKIPSACELARLMCRFLLGLLELKMSRLFLGIALGMSVMFAIAAVEQLLPSWCADPYISLHAVSQTLCK